MSEYQGKKVELNKPMRGDVKKYKVFVKDPDTGNVKKVNFGDPNMEIKRDDPERRKSFRARHKCDTAKDKTTPRYWSCKFWSNKKVSDLLKEIIEPENVDVSSIQLHEELNPLIWSNEKLKPEIRETLLKNAKAFIEYSDLNSIKFSDIIFTGSLANYNYSEHSDVDLHVVFDFKQLSSDDDMVREYLKMKKLLWENNVNIRIKGFDLEMYYQDSNEPHHSTGIYSVYKDEWVKKPVNKIIDIDRPAIQSKVSYFASMIEDLNNIENYDELLRRYNTIKNKIKKYRKSGLENNGEYSVENLTFKVLRNTGYLDMLLDIKNNKLSSELSLQEKNYKNLE
jgi:hypothetical protein